MDGVKELQEVIDFIELHLLEPINYEIVAEEFHTSGFYFHRTFTFMTGMTITEYIRNRRLSMAGQELSMSDMKVIDIAMKYGYDSPESFTKAFTRFHGVSPNVARRAGSGLKLFQRLIIKIKVEGGIVMDYRIEQKEQFYLLAKTKEFANEIVNEEGNHDIPDFWKKCGTEGVFEVLKPYRKNDDTYGICAPMSEESGSFKYGVAIACGEKVDVPAGYEQWGIKPSMWAVFECIGENGQCISDMWDRIHNEFLVQSEYVMLDEPDFEIYPAAGKPGVFCEVWIPVRKK